MKRKFGTLLMVLGAMLLAAALNLYLYNHKEQAQAAQASGEAIHKVAQAIHQRAEQETQPLPSEQPPEPTAAPEQVMSVVDIDGYGYIGFVTIPALQLELPVMTDWTYPQLKICPCRYSGSVYTDDLVIMAHNFAKHFGYLNRLKVGNTVLFTDMDAQVWEYEVVAKDVLNPAAVEDMTAGEYDLTLFTCTYGGESRITIRCDQVSPGQ